MEKLTDNEIIKALECCYGGIKEDCENCPNGATCADIDVVESVIDLINRQKAEVEQWKEEANRYQNLWCEAVKDIQTSKADTIKGVADRLENGEYGQYDWEYKEFIYTQSDIDSLLAEMTEGRENG